LVLVTPDTVVRWHRQGWRLFWRWRSRSGGGRPRLSAEAQELIARISRDNPCWGAERVRGELLKLGLVISNRSIRRYRWKRAPCPPRQSWRTFLANHRSSVWASDLFTVQTLTFRTLYVLLFVSHARRELEPFAVTPQPTAAWVWRQLINATPWGRTPAYLIRDRDAVYGREFVERARGLGVETVLTPVRAAGERGRGAAGRDPAPRVFRPPDHPQRAASARGAGGVRRLRQRRPAAPRARARHAQAAASPAARPDPRQPVLGGLHHTYERAA